LDGKPQQAFGDCQNKMREWARKAADQTKSAVCRTCEDSLMPAWTEPCAGCPRKYGLRAIGGDGPRPARILGIMERPGQDENRNGRVACGKTGQELDELYLPLAGLDRSEVRLCNTVLCGHESNKAPTAKEIAQCAPHHIPVEIERTNPDCILLMGATACSLVQGIRLDYMHGIPQHTSKVGELFGWSGWLVPMFHPAIGLHESRFMTVCMDDWKELGAILKEEHWAGDPKAESYRYERVHGEIAGMHPRIAIDTESHGGKPWSIQWSGYKNTGYLMFADDARGIAKFTAWLLDNPDTEMVFHNAAYDMEVLRKLGIPVVHWRDTMQEAFHLGNLPQGLKALAYRLFRHTMTSYEETVMPASVRALTDWMTEAYMIAQLDLSHVTQRFHKTSGKRLSDKVEKGELESLLTRLLRLTNEESEYDPWERLRDFWREPTNEWMVTHIEARVGKYPVAGIANCSLKEAVRYAVGDADWTGRVAVELERRRQGAFQIHEGDRDA
jgi:uracil-DNA glycosylase family 4